MMLNNVGSLTLYHVTLIITELGKIEMKLRRDKRRQAVLLYEMFNENQL